MNQIWRYSLLGAFLVIADQLIKGTVQTLFVGESPVQDSLVYLDYEVKKALFWGLFPVQNNFAFSILSIWLPLLALFFLLKEMWIFRHKDPLMGWGMALLFTGVLSNLLDRLTLERVVYYLNFNNFLILNIADICIFIGVCIWFERSLRKVF